MCAGVLRLIGGHVLTAPRTDDLVDLIYDAPFEPTRWIGVMERLCDGVGANTACLTELDIMDGSGEGITARTDQSSIRDYMANWTDRNSLLLVDDPVAYAREWRLSIIRDQEWLPPEILHKTNYYNEFLRPLGADHSIMVRLSLDGPNVTALNIARVDGKGAFQNDEIARIARYQPHLVRAVNLGRRLRLAQGALDALDVLLETSPKALFFLDRSGKVRRATAAADALLSSQTALSLRRDRLAATDSRADAALQRLIRATTGGEAFPLDPSLTLQSSEGGKRLVISVSPLGPRSVSAFSSEPLVILGVAEAAAATSPADSLRTLYGLTAAEARVALLMAEGLKIPQIATRCGNSVHTVRAQLSATFSKTGCHRQTDLVRLLLRQDLIPACP